jgi:rhodanese-related sulfurtransferase
MAIVDLDREAVKNGLADGSVLLIDVREPNEFRERERHRARDVARGELVGLAHVDEQDGAVRQAVGRRRADVRVRPWRSSIWIGKR